jgi:F-type H+-transporting ATPase subunit b
MLRFCLRCSFALLAAVFAWSVGSALAEDSKNSKPSVTEEVKAEIAEISKEETGHDEHEHHDPTHAFAGAMQANPMEFRSDGAIFSFIVFLMLLAVLGIFAWKPISEGLAKREATISKALEDAKKASETATAAMKEYQLKIDAAQSQAAEIVGEARKAAEASGQRILAEAKAEAERQRDRALSDIEAAKQSALSELAGKSTDMAFGLARRVVGRELNPNDHQNLIQDALAAMPHRN